MLRHLARFSFLLLTSCSLATAQIVAGIGARRLTGQIRIDGQSAPQGVLVLLDRARGRDSSFVNGSGELGNTMTDSRGKFSFENIDAGMEHPEGRIYVISARYPGYRTTSQIVDLTSTPVGYANLDLRRDTSQSTPNVPAGGPGAMVSAKQPASPKAQDELAKAEELLIQKHDPEASIKGFKKVIEIDNGYAPGYVLLGTAYMQTSRFSEAQSAFEKAVKLQPNDAAAFLGMGAAMNQQQDFSRAVRPLQHSLELRPRSAEAHYELGRSLWALGKWQEAEPHAKEALQIDSGFAPAHILMGNIYLRHKDGAAALSEFQQYLKLDPQGAHAQPVRDIVEKLQKALVKR